MTKQIYEWSDSPGENNFAPGEGGWPELMQRSGVNDAARNDLAALRTWYNDMEWQTVHIVGPDPGDVAAFARTGPQTVTLTLADNNFEGFFPAGRRVKIIDGGGAGVDVELKVQSSNYVNPTTTITLDTTTVIDVGATGVQVYFAKSLGNIAFDDVANRIFIPETQDDAGIAAAIGDANGAGGGIVFLPDGNYAIDSTIDMSLINAPVSIIGSGSAILQNNIGAAGPMLMFSPTPAQLEHRFQGIRFSGVGQSGSVGMDLSGTFSSIVVESCQFDQLDIGISIGASPAYVIANLNIRACKFTSYSQFGIASGVGGPQPVADSNVQISDCMFSGDPGVANAAGVKLGGTARISNCHFMNLGSSAYDEHGVYIWEQSTATDGGQRQTITGCTFSPAGTPGSGSAHGIYCRGSKNVISGNTIEVPNNGYGVQVNAGPGVTFCDANVINGNTINAGFPVLVNRYADRTQIVGNNLESTNASGYCVLDESEGDCSITSNHMNDGLTGVLTQSTCQFTSIANNTFENQTTTCVELNSSDWCHVHGNTFHGPTTNGVTLDATCASCKVTDNHPSQFITNPWVDLSANSYRSQNNIGFNAGVARDLTGDQIPATGSGEVAITGFLGLQLPDAGPGSTYELRCVITAASTGNTPTIRLRVGTLGTISDPIIKSDVGSSTSTNFGSSVQVKWFFTANSSDFVTVTLQGSGTAKTMGRTSTSFWGYDPFITITRYEAQ